MSFRRWIITLVALLVGSNAFAIYRILDNGVTITYMEADLDSQFMLTNQLKAIANLNVIGMHADEVFKTVKTDLHGFELFEKEGCIYAAQVCMKLNSERRVVSIE